MVSPFPDDTCLHRLDAWMAKSSLLSEGLTVCFVAVSNACKRMNADVGLLRSVHAAVRIESVVSSELPPSARLRKQSDRLAVVILPSRVRAINVGRHFAICKRQSNGRATAYLGEMPLRGLGRSSDIQVHLLSGTDTVAQVPHLATPPALHASQQPF